MGDWIMHFIITRRSRWPSGCRRKGWAGKSLQQQQPPLFLPRPSGVKWLKLCRPEGWRRTSVLSPQPPSLTQTVPSLTGKSTAVHCCLISSEQPSVLPRAPFSKVIKYFCSRAPHMDIKFSSQTWCHFWFQHLSISRSYMATLPTISHTSQSLTHYLSLQKACIWKVPENKH